MTAFGETSTVSAEVRNMKLYWPDYYKLFFNRVYNDDAHFGDWRFPLLVHATLMRDVQEHGNEGRTVIANGGDSFSPDRNFAGEFNTSIMFTIKNMLTHNNPMFFVTRELFDACTRTTPPDDVRLSELKMPYESMCFVLPKGAMKYGDHDLHYISVSRMRPGHWELDMKADDGDQTHIGDMINDDWTLTITTTTTSQLYTPTIFMSGDQVSRIMEAVSQFRGMAVHDREILGDAARPMGIDKLEPNDTKFTKEAMSLFFNLVLAMDAKPEVFEKERKIKHKRRDSNVEIWEPNKLGAKYQTRIVGGSVEKGEHASPRTHWRRGHFRRQGIGPRITNCICGCVRGMHCDREESFCLKVGCNCEKFRKPDQRFNEYRTTWIEPILVVGRGDGSAVSATR